MERKLNLAKIAKAVGTPVKTSAVGQSATESPFFSPVASRTRNSKKDAKNDAKATFSGAKLLSENTTPTAPSESIGKIAKKLATQKSTSRKHVKVEYDENQMPVEAPNHKPIGSTMKNESNEDEKATKQAKKRKSTDKKTEVNMQNTKLQAETSEASTSVEKQAKWEPSNWRQLLANIREMRKERNAPVDTMGCDKCYDEHSDEKTKRFHHLVALMLSSQTKDTVTYQAMGRLKSHGLTPQKMVEVSATELEQLLYPVGFYKTKAKHIQKTSQVLIDKFDSDIPNDIKGLVSLPGVGPKMAHICMRVAWNTVTGIGVDVHVHRIANRLKWVEKETKEPEQTRIALEKWLPFEDWSDVNELLVGFGQTICTPINPKCSDCLNAIICPASSVKSKKNKV